jgi:prepilin-type N-terminal cleavage/methylation domain-containing protein
MPHINRRGLTLIELLVVIVILTTLVGGVLPVLSPNNDARKIREAARGLQTFVMQAQSRAARTGRPAGIAFRESSPGSGVALEVYPIEVPPPFAGFSQYSASRVQQTLNNPKAPLQIQFVLTNTLRPEDLPTPTNPRKGLIEYDIEAIPPKFVKYGDIVVVSGVAYRLIDQNYDEDGFYFAEPPEDPQVLLDCELVDDRQTLAVVEEYSVYSAHYGITAARGYQVFRQPQEVTSGAEAPYQFPAGVCIDLQASGTEGGSKPTQFCRGPDYPKPANHLKQIGLLVTPAGGIDKIYYDGYAFGPGYYDIYTTQLRKEARITSISDASRICLLLARVENGGLDLENDRQQELASPWNLRPTDSKEKVAEARARINWLNPDSRWLVMDAHSGRTIVSGNSYVDGRTVQQSVKQGQMPSGKEAVFVQAQLARQLARDMQRGGER